MSPSPTPSQDIQTFHILGCGFGPANLGIAVAILDKQASEQVKHIPRTVFVEKHAEFQWHPGMLLPGSRMQISCLKDLATLRNPSSPFTFLSYLHSQNRLSAFINRGSTIPTRREFADYLAWAAREVERRGVGIAYSEEVIAISKIFLDVQELIEVTSRQVHTEHIILSAGGSPRLPRVLSSLVPSQWSPETSPSVPVLHTASYMTSIRPLLAQLGGTNRPLKIAFVGGGQSSAECVLDMHHRLGALHSKGHQIDMIIRKGSLKPSDDSPFVNEIFDPKITDDWYNLHSDRLRGNIMSEYKNTNYSVVNSVTLDILYELVYNQKLSYDIAMRDASNDALPNVRVSIRTYETVIGAASAPPSESNSSSKRIALTRQHSLTHKLLEDTYDAVICGTGYDRTAWLRLLRSSNIANDFGLVRAVEDVPIKLVPAHYAVEPEEEDAPASFNLKDDHDAATETDHSSTGSLSTPSTPPSSPSLSLSLNVFPAASTTQLRISRAYRLLPTTEGSRSRVYLQGCAEATHGLSDTLLSVIGVRAGEVVDDLWAISDSD
ncbi:hypothetical protein EW145_g391 [Phellinidium pouzarii]|uniref:L-ornithine N(5)-monooxygenase [NAD(P)H] n=1 Tax=Phellinidium pouzarii TaxID=167371 RepID=A0A4S4LP11_9AGAM|nr:hypothetical protein EW145_g391 [Phellinidium pouzarii]